LISNDCGGDDQGERNDCQADEGDSPRPHRYAGRGGGHKNKPPKISNKSGIEKATELQRKDPLEPIGTLPVTNM
jgi:hypothetical protein